MNWWKIALDVQFASIAWMEYIYEFQIIIIKKSKNLLREGATPNEKPGGFATLRSSVKCIYVYLAAKQPSKHIIQVSYMRNFYIEE